MRKALVFFGILDDYDLEWMLTAGSARQVDQDTVLITEGQPVDDVFLVIDGTFSVRVGGLEGKEVARLKSGEILGEMSFVDSRPPSASVRSLERSLVLAIPREKLGEKLRTDTPFKARFYEAMALFLADRLRSSISQLGYGKEPTKQQVDARDELGAEMLDNVDLAGNRFDNMQRRLRGRGAGA